MTQKKLKKRQQMRLLLYIDYWLQQEPKFIIKTGAVKIKIIKITNKKFVVDYLDGTPPREYERLKNLVEDLDKQVLDNFDPFYGFVDQPVSKTTVDLSSISCPI